MAFLSLSGIIVQRRMHEAIEPSAEEARGLKPPRFVAWGLLTSLVWWNWSFKRSRLELTSVMSTDPEAETVSGYAENVIGSEGGRVAGTELKLSHCGRTVVACGAKKAKRTRTQQLRHCPTGSIASMH